MLTENKNVRQRPEEGFRRWFVDDYFDLILWYKNESDTLQGFQLCYNKLQDERAFTYEFSSQGHHFVSKPENLHPGFEVIASGILRDDAGEIPPRVIERFERESVQVDATVRELILHVLRAYRPVSA